MIQSPLNYTGGKYRLLSQILPLFPQKIDTFVDLFCGGCNVGINADCGRVIYNDLNRDLLRLYETLRRLDKETVLSWINEIILRYQLSQTGRFGYDHYGCESSEGLGRYNREGYNRLRADYNQARREREDDYSTVMLYVLIVYAFNNQIRFNRRGEFNLPVGKRDFNRNMEHKLSEFIDRLKGQDCRFTCRDFRDFDISSLGSRDFVYADPPYLITCAPYNEQGGWDEGMERELLAFLDRLHNQGVRFALSNVLRSRGKENHILLEWLKKNQKQYQVIHLNYSYANSNYHIKNRLSASDEVLIVNYRKEGAMPGKFSYQSFCWSLGTTSFRTRSFNQVIEQQLMLIDEFWKLPDNVPEQWAGNSTLQERYYDFLRGRGFLEGDADNKPKDAREKTSGLVDIGLIDCGRRLSPAGTALLSAARAADFQPNNFLQIPRDSFIYLKQLLKTSCIVDKAPVRPFVVLLYVLSQAGELSQEEFTYLLPLCTGPAETEQILRSIRALRAGEGSVDDVIISRLMGMGNYQAALDYFLVNEVNGRVICEVGINRKSRRYDMAYLPLYEHLRAVYIEQNIQALPLAFEDTKNVKIGSWWRNYLFNTTSAKAIQKDPAGCKNWTLFDEAATEEDFKRVFFRTMHLFKAKASLSDYSDLNRRYIRTTNTVHFEDGTVKLDIVPKHFFSSVIEELYTQAYTRSDALFDDCPLEEISAGLVFRETAIIDGVNAELGTAVATVDQARAALEDNRYARLQHLIDTRFTDQNLLLLLEHFEKRKGGKGKETEIKKMVTNDADLPTIFEYVLGIIWYKVSGRQGKVLDYMKLSLDADLLPKTHAAGGEADIVYEYGKSAGCPEHTLLLEATLADNTNQRKMEMEPVSRHLGEHILKSGKTSSYCVFVTTSLHINVISDFRGRKHMPYYDNKDYDRFVDGTKIIPLQTSELKKIIAKGWHYQDLYQLFEEAFQSSLPPHQWYESCISAKL